MRKDKLSRRDFVKSSFVGAIATSPLLVRHQSLAADTRTGGNGNTRAGAAIRSDMSQCQPSEALSRGFEKDRWQLIDYETVEGVKGTMVSARPESRCAALTLPLNVEGLYKIYVGINYTKAEYLEWPSYGQLEVKLSTEDGFR